MPAFQIGYRGPGRIGDRNPFADATYPVVVQEAMQCSERFSSVEFLQSGDREDTHCRIAAGEGLNEWCYCAPVANLSQRLRDGVYELFVVQQGKQHRNRSGIPASPSNLM